MEATTEVLEQELDLEPEDNPLSDVTLPDKDEFVACTTCGVRSWMHFYFMDDLMSFCKYHGEISKPKLESVGGVLVFDNRPHLLETT